MKNILKIVPLAVLALASTTLFASPEFQRKDLVLFEKTNQCPGCDLSNAELPRNHSGALLAGANLSGIKVLYRYNASQPNEWKPLNLSNSDLSNANLSGSDLNSANLSQANLTGAHLDGADLEQANLYGAINANLTNADVCNATMPDGGKGICEPKLMKKPLKK